MVNKRRNPAHTLSRPFKKKKTKKETFNIKKLEKKKNKGGWIECENENYIKSEENFSPKWKDKTHKNPWNEIKNKDE